MVLMPEEDCLSWLRAANETVLEPERAIPDFEVVVQQERAEQERRCFVEESTP